MFLDIHSTGTLADLADLADTQDDLAVIALPPAQVPSALAIAGRIKCRAALVISSGIDSTLAAELHKQARRDGVYRLGPNCLGLQRPNLQLNASVAGALAAPALADARGQIGKPLLTCWMGDASVGEARQLLAEAAIPTFRTPEAAVGAFGNIASFYQNQLLLQQTPPPLSDLAQPDVEGARMVIESVLAERRKVLADNSNMLKLMRDLGFAVKVFEEDRDYKLVTHQL